MLLDAPNPYRPALPDILRLHRADFEFVVSEKNLEAVGRRARWTVIVFLAADVPDLCAPMFDNLLQMKQVGSDDVVNVCVFFAGPLLSDSFFARLSRDTSLAQDIVFRFLHVPTNQAGPLTEAIVNARAAFPAEHTLLVLSGHGLGWRGALRSDTVWQRYKEPGKLVLPAPPDVCNDHLRHCYDQALAAIRARLPPDAAMGPATPDLLALDACYMGSLEVVAQFQHEARILVVSEDQMPGEGYPYDRLLAALRANPDQTPEQVAALLVNETKQSYQGGPRRRKVTQAALVASRVSALCDRVGDLAAALAPVVATESGAQELERALAAAWSFERQGTVDLKGLALQLADAADEGVRAAAAALASAHDEAIVAAAVPGGPSTPNGLTFYAPTPAEFDAAYLPLVNQLPPGLRFWTTLLGLYYRVLLGDKAADHPLVRSVVQTMNALRPR